jgi:diguanylate cyclase (GGDEF)-like protein
MSNKENKDYQRYYIQSNLVYFGAIAMHILLGIFFAIIGSQEAFMANLVTLSVAVYAVFLNREYRYAFASFIYILTTSIVVSFQIVIFGMEAGLFYYYLNMAMLIIFTNWKNSQKLMGIALVALLAMVMHQFVYFQTPIYILERNIIHLWHHFNLILNMFAIGHSAYFFMKIADEAEERLTIQAKTDFVTGVKNRGALMMTLDHEIEHHVHLGGGFGVIMGDIDHFKRINDTYGHITGDYVLARISQLLIDCLRDTDVIGRYGGEEFLMICHVKDLNALQSIAQRMRENIAKHDFEFQGDKLSITMSFGAVYIKYKDEDITSEKVIDLADQQLYVSKSNGRNMVSAIES